MTLRLRVYRSFHQSLVERHLLRWFASAERLHDARRNGIAQRNFSERKPGKKRFWFHAASVGELESLWSVITAFAEGSGAEIILTVFSESAHRHVQRLAQQLSTMPGAVFYAGYSPWEGGWQESLRSIQPDVFITAKYEAWPELWVGLAASKVPLVIVGAKPRRSLRVAEKICRWLGSPLPKMLLLAQSEADCRSLQTLFPAADIRKEADPRWDRVVQRSLLTHPRVQELSKIFSVLPRPWGIVGSAWATDLAVWRAAGGPPKEGTLWIVPHKTDRKTVVEMEILLREWGLTPVRSTDGSRISGQPCVLVDEMGFLSELYALADWAFVGGGFGAGVHSTIEPAIHGMPIAAGPKGAAKFDEMTLLQATGQLTLVDGSGGLFEWLKKVQAVDAAQRATRQIEWKVQAKARLGAASRVLELLFSHVSLESCQSPHKTPR